MEVFLIITVVFCAVLTQSISGIGVVLVDMAFLPGLLGIQTAAPLVALGARAVQSQPAEILPGQRPVCVGLSRRENLNYDAEVWQSYLWCLPAFAAGVFVGFWAEDRSDPAIFRRVVLLLLIAMGVRLIL